MSLAAASCPAVFRFSTALAALAPEVVAARERPWLWLGALAAALCDCGADAAALQLQQVDATLAGAGQDVRLASGARWLLAGILAQDAMARDAFVHEHWRACAQLRAAGVHCAAEMETFSVLIMILRSPRRHLQASDIARTALTHRLVRGRHRWGAPGSGGAIAATLAAARGPAQDVDQICAELIEKLAARTGAPSEEVDAAAAMLVASPVATGELIGRMDALLEASHASDQPGALPALALLAQLACPADEAAAQYLAIRESLAAVGDSACARIDALVAAGLAYQSLARLDACSARVAQGHARHADAGVRRFHADLLLASAVLLHAAA
jgi:hypothetical protein